ncbi:MAG TPA: copper chaperone PCu(A)C, partial [Longimicrobiales bacterium]|nr:copper chaperone PCu(A)C [Longimicrobiales bacterium]
MPGTALAALTIAAVVLACGGDPGLAGGREEGGGRALPAVTEGDLVVSSVVMPAPVTPERAALYFDVRNGGSEPDTPVAVDLGALGSAGLHETVTTDGVARMRPRDRVPVQGGATLRF